MYRNLRNQMLVLNMVMITIVMITAFIAIYMITYTNIKKENERKLASIPLATSLATFPSTSQVIRSDNKILIARVPANYSPSFSLLVNEDGKVTRIMSYIDLPDDAYDQIATQVWRKSKPGGSITYEGRKWQYRVIAPGVQRILNNNGNQAFIRGDGLYRIAFLDITDSSRTLTQLLVAFVIVGIAMLFSLFGICYYFANRSIRPIEQSWIKQKQFIADASHELKTPLAIVNANVDALLTSSESTVRSQVKWIDHIRMESDRMNKLINSMLYMAKAEDGQEIRIPNDLSNIVRNVTTSMEAVFYEKEIELAQSIENNMIVYGDEEKIRQVATILLDNAVKYTPENGRVDIKLAKSRNKAFFTVTNSGSGIPEDQLPHVFDRFYRCDHSRSQLIEGHGLGLSIARTIIERSGGALQVRSNGDGTIFTVELNLAG